MFITPVADEEAAKGTNQDSHLFIHKPTSKGSWPMGAWGYGIFDDDTAYDFFDEISEDPRGFFTRSFLNATSAQMLDYDSAHAVTVSAAYMDNSLNGTQYRTDTHDNNDETNINCFGSLHPELDLRDLVPLALDALRQVIGNQSELNELWATNVALYPKWKGTLELLIERLQNSTRRPA